MRFFFVESQPGSISSLSIDDVCDRCLVHTRKDHNHPLQSCCVQAIYTPSLLPRLELRLTSCLDYRIDLRLMGHNQWWVKKPHDIQSAHPEKVSGLPGLHRTLHGTLGSRVLVSNPLEGWAFFVRSALEVSVAQIPIPIAKTMIRAV